MISTLKAYASGNGDAQAAPVVGELPGNRYYAVDPETGEAVTNDRLDEYETNDAGEVIVDDLGQARRKD